MACRSWRPLWVSTAKLVLSMCTIPLDTCDVILRVSPDRPIDRPKLSILATDNSWWRAVELKCWDRNPFLCCQYHSGSIERICESEQFLFVDWTAGTEWRAVELTFDRGGQFLFVDWAAGTEWKAVELTFAKFMCYCMNKRAARDTFDKFICVDWAVRNIFDKSMCYCANNWGVCFIRCAFH